MKNFTPLNLSLPELSREQPVSEWIHTASVTGTYGITASVKDFNEVMDWQEHRRELTQGYYRLIHPPMVQEFKFRLQAKYPGFTAVLFTSGAVAEKELLELLEVEHLSIPLKKYDEIPADLIKNHAHVFRFSSGAVEVGVVLLGDKELAGALHERNRRRGGSLSARNVDYLLGKEVPGLPGEGIKNNCAKKLKEMEKASSVFFYPSGMGAVTAALDLVITPQTPHVLVLGNVYRDTHLILEEQVWAGRKVCTTFLDTHDLEGLRARVHQASIGAVMIETITNPLIEIPDLPAIAAMCKQAGKPLLVDSTMAGPLNVCPLELGATVVIHSTSKYLSGSNTHGGGVVLTNDDEWVQKLNSQQVRYHNYLSPLEFPALWQGIQTYPARLLRFNRNGEALAAMLRNHPAVETVYYGNQGVPDWLNGLGSVVSCDLKDASIERVAAFFDADLPGVIKAPSLGSDQTLFCPYVLLAYYDKSDAYLADCNLSKNLLRFAAGCEEDFSEVLAGIRTALDAC